MYNNHNPINKIEGEPVGIEKVRVKTSFKEDLIVTVAVGNKIQEAMINGTEYVKISEKPLKIIKVKTVLLLEHFTERDPLKKLELPSAVRAFENSDGYKKFSKMRQKMLNKKSL